MIARNRTGTGACGQRIGLFGGSFDPVHLGHLLVAQAAGEELGLARVCFIPAARSPFKPDSVPAPASARLRMLRLALCGHDYCEVDTQEIDRGGVSYTIDTVNTYLKQFPAAALFYLIGADHLPSLPQWRRAGELAERVEFVVIPRPDQAAVTVPDGFKVRLLKGFPLAVSSSDIRVRVQAGRLIRHLVPRVVAEEIRNNRLYLLD